MNHLYDYHIVESMLPVFFFSVTWIFFKTKNSVKFYSSTSECDPCQEQLKIIVFYCRIFCLLILCYCHKHSLHRAGKCQSFMRKSATIRITFPRSLLCREIQWWKLQFSTILSFTAISKSLILIQIYTFLICRINEMTIIHYVGTVLSNIVLLLDFEYCQLF